MDDAQLRYSRVAVTLHWLIAVIIVFELCVGLIMEGITNPAVRIPIVQLHGSFGVTVLLLSIARLGWRLTHRPPPHDPRLAWWEHRLADLVHKTLYVMMFAMPLIGWSILSASPRMLKAGQFLFWQKWLRWPALPIISTTPQPRLDQLHEQFVRLHTIGGYIVIALLVFHVAGALKHQLLDRHQPFRRIWFGA